MSQSSNGASLLSTTIDRLFDARAHLLSRLFDERAEGYADCFKRLGERKAIAEELAGRLASAARLRNLLVHRYWEIDDRRVYSSIKGGRRGLSF
ncbi:MAG: HepT-like ribonuclease domain-containing protein [Candidatus Bathyarchaeota archaeon]